MILYIGLLHRFLIIYVWSVICEMKKLKIFLAIILFLIVVIVGVIWWQHNNIKMAYYSYKFDNTQIDDKIQKNNDEVDTYLKEQNSFNVRPSTDIEQKLHKAKLITDDEFVQILTGKTDIKSIFGFDISYDEASKGFVTFDGDKLSVEYLAEVKEGIRKKNIADGVSSNANSPGDKSGTGGGTATFSGESNNSGSKTPGKSSGVSEGKSDKSKDTANISGNNEKLSVKDKSQSGISSGNTLTDAAANGSNTANGSYVGSNNVSGALTGAPGESAYPSNSTTKSNSKLDSAEGNSQNSGISGSLSEADAEKASECIAQMYVIKSSFESELDVLYGEAKEYYSQLVAEDKKNIKSEMVKKFYSQATSLEGQCDQKVESVLSELSSVLESSGDDAKIVDKIRDMYHEEKSLKKAYYLNLAK